MLKNENEIYFSSNRKKNLKEKSITPCQEMAYWNQIRHLQTKPSFFHFEFLEPKARQPLVHWKGNTVKSLINGCFCRWSLLTSHLEQFLHWQQNRSAANWPWQPKIGRERQCKLIWQSNQAYKLNGTEAGRILLTEF